MRTTVRRADMLVIDLPDRSYRDGEKVRVSVDDDIAKYIDSAIPVVITIGGVKDQAYSAYAEDGRRLRAGDMLNGQERVLTVVAGNGGKFVEE